MMYFEFMKNLPLASSGEQMPVRPITASRAKNVSRHDVLRFMKNFLLADSGEQMPVRLITAS